MREHPLYVFEEDGKSFDKIQLTGEEAQLILDERGFENQRVRDINHVLDLQTMMDNGDWKGETLLTFAKNGDGRIHLVDGQHRLAAFVEHARKQDDDTTMGFLINVVDDVPFEVYAHLDAMQKKRPAAVVAEALGLSVHRDLLKVCLSAAAYAMRYSGFTLKRKIGERNASGNVPYRNRRQYLEMRKSALERAGKLLDLQGGGDAARAIKKYLTQSRVLPVVLETLNAESDEGFDFWTGVIVATDNSSAVQGNLQTCLMQGFGKVHPASVSFRARMCASAWNNRNGTFKVSRAEKPDGVTIKGAKIDGRDVVVAAK